MTDDNTFEQFKKSNQYSSLLDIFTSIKYNQDVSQVMPNTAYICCNLLMPDYDVPTKKKKIFDYNTKFSFNNSNIFQGTIMFYSKNQYLGCYNDVNNTLYLIDIIPSFLQNDDFNIINDIIGILHKTKEKHIQLIERELKVRSKSKLMIGKKIYDLTTNIIELSFLDKLLHRTPTGCIHCTDNKIYQMELTDEHDIGLDSYKTEIAEKAHNLISGYRQKYYEDTLRVKNSYKKVLEDNIPMPNFSAEGIAKSGLMLAVEKNRILYMFRVDIKVHTVISENVEIYAKLSKPVYFDNGLLTIVTTLSGNVLGARFKHKHKHFHVDDEEAVCLGTASTKITSTKVSSLNDILKLKSSIVDMLSICNVSSMNKKAYKSEEVEQAIRSSRVKSLDKLVIDSES